MEATFDNILGYIKANFFYDLRSTVLTICFLLGMYFFFKLLKYDNEKVAKSMKYLTYVVIFGAVFILLY